MHRNRTCKRPVAHEGITSLDELYQRSAQALEGFQAEIRALAEATGGEAHFRAGDGLKLRARAEEKLGRDYGGDASRVVDTLGGTITYESHADVLAALAEIERRAYEAGARKVWKKDRFENPSGGYKDVRVNIQRADGLVTELLLTTRAMQEAKMGPGHDLYEAKQLVDLFLEKGEGTPAQREEAQLLSDQLGIISETFYGSTGDQSNVTASLSSIVEPFNEISALRSLVSSSVYPKLESLLGNIRKSLPLVEKAYGTSSYSTNLRTNMGSLAVPISQPALVGSLPSANRMISGTEAPPSVSSNITPSAPKGKSGPAVLGRETTIIIEGQPKEAARYEAREAPIGLV